MAMFSAACVGFFCFTRTARFQPAICSLGRTLDLAALLQHVRELRARLVEHRPEQPGHLCEVFALHWGFDCRFRESTIICRIVSLLKFLYAPRGVGSPALESASADSYVAPLRCS